MRNVLRMCACGNGKRAREILNCGLGAKPEAEVEERREGHYPISRRDHIVNTMAGYMGRGPQLWKRVMDRCQALDRKYRKRLESRLRSIVSEA